MSHRSPAGAVKQTIDWLPLSPLFGAELTGGQLIDLDDGQVDALMMLLAARGVVVARSQTMSVEEQLEFARRLGPLYAHPFFADESQPEVVVIRSDETTQHVAGETWHSDLSCETHPAGISVLTMRDVPGCGGDTAFADMYRAYEELSAPIRRLLEGLTAHHDSPAAFVAAGRSSDLPSADHPVVRIHPMTGRPALFVNSGYTTRVNDLRDRESDTILRLLFDHVAYGVARQLRVHWAAKTTVLWDNRCVQHHAVFDYHPARRLGHRVTTIGERPLGVNGVVEPC